MNTQCYTRIWQSVRIASLGRKAIRPQDAFRMECDHIRTIFSTERRIPNGMQTRLGIMLSDH
ncbi:MAG: hypothetical protein LBE91_18350 [Tannerella sp.]|jgi:hypothetical protein|nr:hypothetical protein [Tannerella sp.]